MTATLWVKRESPRFELAVKPSFFGRAVLQIRYRMEESRLGPVLQWEDCGWGRWRAVTSRHPGEMANVIEALKTLKGGTSA